MKFDAKVPGDDDLRRDEALNCREATLSLRLRLDAPRTEQEQGPEPPFRFN